MGIKNLYIDPGSPWQNGCIESFLGRFREECLNRMQLWTLTEARVVIEGQPSHASLITGYFSEMFGTA